MIVSLTALEIAGLLRAIGNSLTGDPDDESSIVGDQKHIAAAYRAQAKLVRAARLAASPPKHPRDHRQ